jgi:xanthine dehydrogenase accessory factor
MSEAGQVYKALAEVHKTGKLAALATVIRTQGSVPRHAGAKMLVYADGQIVGTVGGGAMESRVVDEAKQIMQTGEAATFTYSLTDLGAGDPGICGGTAEIFVEPIGVMPTLVVIGCGHVGKALAALAKWSGFRVIVSDDRADYCNAEHVPDADEYLPVPAAELLDHLSITPLTYIAAVTRGLPVDEELFPKLLASDAPYVGLIGSKRRWTLTRKALIENHGIDAETVDRVHSPIGIEIGAETPEEIAISIMAEIIAQHRGV